jgi:hypothetical protein
MYALRERAWRPTSIKRWMPTLFQPVGNGKRDHNCQNGIRGLPPLNGDFFNAIDQNPKWLK